MALEGTNTIQTHSQGHRIWTQYLAAFIVNLNLVASGMCIGWTATALPYLQGTAEDSLRDEYYFYNVSSASINNSENARPYTSKLSITESSMIASLHILGIAVGSAAMGSAANSFGKRSVLLFTTVPFTICWGILSVSERYIYVLLVVRFIQGIATGICSTITPLYLEEIASISIRGSLGVIFRLMFTFGLFYVYICGAYTTYFWMNLICAGPTALAFCLMFFIPESPEYFLLRGRQTDALRSLEWLRGTNCDNSAELISIQRLVEKTSERNIIAAVKSVTHLSRNSFKSNTAKAFYISVFLVTMLQAGGNTTFLSFTVEIFEATGCSITPYNATVVFGCVGFLSSVFSLVTVDYVGRRMLLILSTLGTSFFLLVLSLYLFLKSRGYDVTNMEWVPIACLSLSSAVFNLGVGCVGNLIMAEISPAHAKGWISGSSMILFSLTGFFINNYFLPLTETVGYAITFAIFGLINTFSLLIVVMFVPETKRKTIQEIQDSLRKVTLTGIISCPLKRSCYL